MNFSLLKFILIKKHGTVGHFEDSFGSDVEIFQAAYEVAYFYEYGSLPENATAVKSVIRATDGGGYTFIFQNDKIIETKAEAEAGQ